MFMSATFTKCLSIKMDVTVNLFTFFMLLFITVLKVLEHILL